MAVIVKDIETSDRCSECRFCKFVKRDVFQCLLNCYGNCQLKPVEGLIDELEIYAGNQCDSWDNSVVNGTINIIKEYCGIGEDNADI